MFQECSLQILWRSSQNWRIYGVFRGAVSNARMSHAELWTRFPQNYIFQPRWQSTEKTIRPIDMSKDIYCSENPLLLRDDQLFSFVDLLLFFFSNNSLTLYPRKNGFLSVVRHFVIFYNFVTFWSSRNRGRLLVSKFYCFFEFRLTIWPGDCQRDKHFFAAAQILTKSIHEINSWIWLEKMIFFTLQYVHINYTKQ